MWKSTWSRMRADSMRSGQTDLRISRTSINESPGSTYLSYWLIHTWHNYSFRSTYLAYWILIDQKGIIRSTYLPHWSVWKGTRILCVFQGVIFKWTEIITWSTGFGHLADQRILRPLFLPERLNLLITMLMLMRWRPGRGGTTWWEQIWWQWHCPEHQPSRGGKLLGWHIIGRSLAVADSELQSLKKPPLSIKLTPHVHIFSTVTVPVVTPRFLSTRICDLKVKVR